MHKKLQNMAVYISTVPTVGLSKMISSVGTFKKKIKFIITIMLLY